MCVRALRALAPCAPVISNVSWQKTMSAQTEHAPDPIDECFDGLKSLDLFVETTLLGVHHASDATGWLEVGRQLSELKGKAIADVDAKHQEAKRRSQELEGFAQREGSSGHPYLYGLAVVRIWTILEALADDVTLMRLRVGKYSTDASGIGDLKLPLRDVLGVSPERQAESVLAEIKQANRARVQQGVGRFESVLGSVSLAGSVEESVRKALFECCQVRNLVVHRNGVVDAKFVRSCPWFSVAVGDPLPLGRMHFQVYYHAAFWYALAVHIRLKSLDAEALDPKTHEVQKLFLANVESFQATRPAGV